MLGLGYHGTVTPPVIRRNVLEDPAWYTAYTPYQPEISQGRLEALLNFQTMVCDLTGLDVAGASMLDESTAAAEAMLLLRRADKTGKEVRAASSSTPTRCPRPSRCWGRAPRRWASSWRSSTSPAISHDDFFGLLLAAPGASGVLRDHRAVVEAAHDRGAAVVAACDLLAATMVTPPGDLGADVAVGSTQRFGVPLGFGGPHAGFLAVRQGLARQLPGRLVGTSIDADGDPAHRLALQTREQHIRRDKATSNICTAQVLLAVIAAMYAVHHGPTGLRTIARRTHRMAAVLAAGLVKGGVEVVHREFFDTVLVRVPGGPPAAVAACRDEGILVREVDADHVGVSCSERTTREHLRALWRALGAGELDVEDLDAATADAVPATLERTSSYLTHPVFHRHRSETSLLRYLRELSDKDVALDRSMIPLGSCTMKLNATAEMEPITYPGFGDLHPFAPASDAPGMLQVITTSRTGWCTSPAITRCRCSPTPARRASSPACSRSAPTTTAGATSTATCASSRRRRTAPTRRRRSRRACGSRSSRPPTAATWTSRTCEKVIGENGDTLAAIMITYPSTHGVYEPHVRKVCAAVHDAGGQVYVDGANLNALVGLARPGRFGADVAT